MLTTIPSFSDIKRAHQRISEHITRTPVLTSQNIDEIAGCNLYFKCENFQKIGAFKMRGASNAIFSYRPEERVNGFACHSSGNHGQAVALAANLAGSKAYIVMPENSTKVKMEAVRGYGAEIVHCENNEHAREETCKRVIEEKGTMLVHPFNDYDVIAGQATACKELIEEVEDLDIVITPVGGGGLASGTCLSAHYLQPGIEVYLGEPEGANDTYHSFKAGEIIPNEKANTIADGLRTTVGKIPFGIIKEHVKDVLTVTDDEIVEAMKLIWERMKIVIEPSAAVTFASILKNKHIFSGKKVGVMLTGGNVDLTNLPF